MISLPLSSRPGATLTGHDHRQAIEVGDDLAIHVLIEAKQSGLVREQLSYSDGTEPFTF